MSETQAANGRNRARLLLEEMTRGVQEADTVEVQKNPEIERLLAEVKEEKTQTIETLIEYTNQFPQVRDGKIVYVVVKGFARELLLRASNLEPLNQSIPIKSRLKENFQPRFLESVHGDIDVVHLDKKQLRILWVNWRTLLNSGTDIDNDSSVRTFAASLLGIQDFTEPRLHQDKLDRYYCFADVHEGKFVVPRPEVMLLEYKDLSSNRAVVREKGFLSDLLGKYEMDMGLLDELIDKHEQYSEKVWGVKKPEVASE